MLVLQRQLLAQLEQQPEQQQSQGANAEEGSSSKSTSHELDSSSLQSWDIVKQASSGPSSVGGDPFLIGSPATPKAHQRLGADEGEASHEDDAQWYYPMDSMELDAVLAQELGFLSVAPPAAPSTVPGPAPEPVLSSPAAFVPGAAAAVPMAMAVLVASPPITAAATTGVARDSLPESWGPAGLRTTAPMASPMGGAGMWRGWLSGGQGRGASRPRALHNHSE